ncbi:MAG: DUF4221 domain-containing protein [Roseivirga sp.]
MRIELCKCNQWVSFKYKYLKSRLILSLLSFFIFLSCAADRKERANLPAIEIEEIRSIQLQLDAETTNSNPYYQYIETDSMPLLALFNRLNYSIYLFDLASEKQVAKYPFEEKGPDGLGSRVTFFQIMSKDSVFFHSYYNRMVYVNKLSGQRVHSYKLFTEDSELYPDSGAGFPVTILDDRLVVGSGLPCNWQDDDRWRANSVTIINRTDNDVSFDLKQSVSYADKRGGVYWPHQLCALYSTYNSESGEFMYSSPLENEVKLTDHRQEAVSVDFGSPEFSMESAVKKPDLSNDPMVQLRQWLGYSRYGSIHYDPFRKIYLRSFYPEIPDEKLEQDVLRVSRKMLFANKDFDILGEAELLGNDDIFFTKEGLNQVIFDSSKEDILEVKVYKYVFDN